MEATEHKPQVPQVTPLTAKADNPPPAPELKAVPSQPQPPSSMSLAHPPLSQFTSKRASALMLLPPAANTWAPLPPASPTNMSSSTALIPRVLTFRPKPKPQQQPEKKRDIAEEIVAHFEREIFRGIKPKSKSKFVTTSSCVVTFLSDAMVADQHIELAGEGARAISSDFSLKDYKIEMQPGQISSLMVQFQYAPLPRLVAPLHSGDKRRRKDAEHVDDAKDDRSNKTKRVRQEMLSIDALVKTVTELSNAMCGSEWTPAGVKSSVKYDESSKRLSIAAHGYRTLRKDQIDAYSAELLTRCSRFAPVSDRQFFVHIDLAKMVVHVTVPF